MFKGCLKIFQTAFSFKQLRLNNPDLKNLLKFPLIFPLIPFKMSLSF
ncbi:hypothetical protein NEIFL0001_1055 [Neisseria flavescens SK114]|nr:hypothetical protein NEIFL0001_1055 [Neisseria flavescens SK114]